MALVIMYEPGMERIDDIAEDASYEACKEIADDIRNILRPHRRTGAMARSVRARKTKKGGRVYVGTDHWPYVEYGTEMHIIASQGDYGMINRVDYIKPRYFGRLVEHPGATAIRPIRRAFFKKRSMASLVIPDLPDLGSDGMGNNVGPRG